MACTRNITIAIPSELHARYVCLGLPQRKAVLSALRKTLGEALEGRKFPTVLLAAHESDREREPEKSTGQARMTLADGW